MPGSQREMPADYACVVGRLTVIGPFGLFLDDTRIVEGDAAWAAGVPGSPA